MRSNPCSGSCAPVGKGCWWAGWSHARCIHSCSCSTCSCTVNSTQTTFSTRFSADAAPVDYSACIHGHLHSLPPALQQVHICPMTTNPTMLCMLCLVLPAGSSLLPRRSGCGIAEPAPSPPLTRASSAPRTTLPSHRP